jgi:hypothetical protein
MTRLEQIKYVKEKANIVDVIGHFVQLKRDGSGYKGISPFTNERNASFTVQPSKNIFKCFSSGKGGDVIDFIMLSQGYGYTDALSWLVSFCNMPPTDNDWKYTAPIDLPVSYTPHDLAISTIRMEPPNGSFNYFTNWLVKIFDVATANSLILKYNIGTSKYWRGANIFWQVDSNDLIRGGKIMCYNPATGKRIKDPEALITWVHKAGRMKNYNLSQCLYGEHLLSQRPDAPVKIVESEKTAIVASVIYPEFIWLASCSLSNLTVARCMPLKGRKVSLIPDTGAEDAWLEKASQLRKFIPDCFVDIIPGDNPKGYDLCDYILDNKI